MGKTRARTLTGVGNATCFVKLKDFGMERKSPIGNKHQDAKSAGIKLRNCVVKPLLKKTMRNVRAEVALQVQRKNTISHSTNTGHPTLRKCLVRLKRLPTTDSSKKVNCHHTTGKDVGGSVIEVPRFNNSCRLNDIPQRPQSINKNYTCLNPPKIRTCKILLPRFSVLEKSQLNSNSIFNATSFEPIRNSTICQLPESPDSQNESHAHSGTVVSVSHNEAKKPLQNFANKSSLIEEILLTDDTVSGNVEKIVEPPKATQKGHKFFFKKKKNETEVNFRIRKAGKTSMKRKSTKSHNVYDFLSLSQNSDSEKHEDPAADIIKKMINEGRVVVTTLKKGRGKPKVKQQRKVKKVRPVGKRRQCSLDDIAKQVESTTHISKTHEAASNEPTQEPLSPVYESNVAATDTLPEPLSPVYEPYVAATEPLPELLSPVYEADSDQESYVVDTEVTVHELTPDGSVQFATRAVDTKRQNKSTEGSISKLARSVLINQTKNNNKSDLPERRRLLDIARKFVSTPVNKKATTTSKTGALHTTNLSPIVAPSRQQSGGQSPWRVSDETPLPNTFFFSRNTSNLPSFSSDYIPSTPHKQNKSISIHQTTLNSQTVVQHSNNVETLSPIHNQSLSPDEAPSAYETNDSNGENVAPSPCTSTNSRLNDTTLSKQNDSKKPSDNQENENYIHLPNPRRGLQYRSPLKSINILDVITLPSWKSNTTPAKEKLAPAGISSTAAVANQSEQTPSKQHLFGFEDFLNNSVANESDDDIDGSCTIANINKTGSNKTLHEKLQNLRTIRPADEELPRPGVIPMSHPYDDIDTRRQRNIRDMLCSTMINNKTLHSEVDDTRDLFNDNDPETTFNNQKPHQTYVRPNKRKRKQRHQFVMFMDSDPSEEEDEESPANPKNRQVQKHKKKCTQKETVQLKEFVTSFNAMCKEVEEFEMPME